MLMLLNATRWREPVTEKPELDSGRDLEVS